MSNPFETPLAAGPPTGGGTGTFDLGTALQHGWDATVRNWPAWLGSMVVAGALGVLSIVMCVLPALVVLPALGWGMTVFTLQAVDGEAPFQTLFTGFDRLGDAVPKMLLLFVGLFVVSLPGSIVSWVMQGVAAVAGDDAGAIVLLGSLVGSLISLGWSLVVMPRFMLAAYLVVDGGLQPIDALTRSWELTGLVWGRSIAFYFVAMMALPVLGVLFCCVGVFPAYMVGTGALASVYRQMVGHGEVG